MLMFLPKMHVICFGIAIPCFLLSSVFSPPRTPCADNSVTHPCTIMMKCQWSKPCSVLTQKKGGSVFPPGTDHCPPSTHLLALHIPLRYGILWAFGLHTYITPSHIFVLTCRDWRELNKDVGMRLWTTFRLSVGVFLFLFFYILSTSEKLFLCTVFAQITPSFHLLATGRALKVQTLGTLETHTNKHCTRMHTQVKTANWWGLHYLVNGLCLAFKTCKTT